MNSNSMLVDMIKYWPLVIDNEPYIWMRYGFNYLHIWGSVPNIGVKGKYYVVKWIIINEDFSITSGGAGSFNAPTIILV